MKETQITKSKFEMFLPFLQTFPHEQYSPSSQSPRHVFLLGVRQVFSQVREDSLQTVFTFWLEQSDEDTQESVKIKKGKFNLLSHVHRYWKF